MDKKYLSNNFYRGLCFIAIFSVLYLCKGQTSVKNICTVAFVPTYTEIGKEWIQDNDFRRIDKNDSLPAYYQNGSVLLAITGVGLEMTHNSLQNLLNEECPLNKNVKFILTGTAGSYTIPAYTVVNCNSPFKSDKSRFPAAKLVCVHEFVSADNPHPELQAPDVCFDMESEAFCRELKVQKKCKVKSFTILKVISDGGDGTEEDWETATIKHCRPKIQNILKELIK